ncbi:hypothetical protein COU59_02225 [Candidatus Pacearchaeota archaeon CG10_big_fil_rev_8_21_14_0_10_34_12]|nr:MAG: hypothetical protein COU59_02225 [Candidatus Pacearchaeota archaeon CG10_big_fil_rev_8_21_14_0_10_34_12]
MENKQKTEIVEKNPQLKDDVTLFKIILMPLELYVLKFFLSNLRPTNIREVYTDAIFTCFHNLFFPEGLQEANSSHKFLVQNLIGAGYGYGLIDEKEKKDVVKKYLKETKSISETEQRKLWLEQIIKHNSKAPSYDKIKGIFENFEKLGIIYKRGKEGKGIVFALNPQFYNLFKDKRKEIIQL